MNVYVFKTSVSQSDLETLEPILLHQLPGCLWTFDLEDVDNVLRIESATDITTLVCELLHSEKYRCEELE